MRHMRRSISKISMAGIGAVLLATAAMPAEAPAGMVLLAHNASVDRATVSLGANVYPGDSLNTSAGGTLRLRIGAGQIYMMAMTDATLSNDENRVSAHLVRGTAGFSATAADPLELDTPVGILRPADNSRAFGQVTIFGPNHVVITSYEGKLLLTRNGESKTIEPGKSYSVSVKGAAPGAAPAPQTPQGFPNSGGGGGNNNNNNSGAVAFDSIVVGTTIVTGYVVYTVLSESGSDPSN